MTRERIHLGIAIALVAAVFVWLALSFERVDEREYVGLQGEAQRNPYLAAERLFERMGMKVVRVAGQIDSASLPHDGVLILPRGHWSLGPEQAHELVRFAEGGGQLIVEAEPIGKPDGLLGWLDVDRVAARGKRDAQTAAITLAAGETPLKVRLAPVPRLIDRAKTAALDQADGRLLRFVRGQGLITIVNDFSFMRYKQLASEEHAQFLLRLARTLPGSRTVVIASHPQTPSLWQWLVENALAVLLSAAALLALCLWRIAPRFGPLAPDAGPARKRLLDHLRASGRFHWNSGGAARLAGAAREACLRNIARVHPEIAGLPPRESARRLAALSGLKAERIERALGDGVLPAHEFTEAVRTLQMLQEKLVRSW